MSLSTSLNIAQQALATNAALSSVVSRNIAGQNDPNYSVKSGQVVSDASGIGTLVGVTSATNAALFSNLLSATSAAASSQAMADGLDTLEQTVNLTSASTSTTSTATDTSVATAIGKLTTALQTYAATPSDAGVAATVLAAAKSLAGKLNGASSTIQTVRAQADSSIAASVAKVNTLLQQFATANTAVMQGTASGSDVTDSIDSRNKILKDLSKEMGITTVAQPSGGMAIYTDSGVTLFQGSARSVTFAPTVNYAAGSVGNAVTVDGVPVTGSSSVMSLKTGAIAGLAQLRDTTTVNYQNQLDQLAGGLIDGMAETGGSTGTVAGLFTAPGITLPASSGVTGLAAAIITNASVDPAQGGTLTLLRDGGIGGGTSVDAGNTTGAASYSGYINALIGKLDATRSFGAASGGAASGSLAAYAGSSVSWLEAARQGATRAASDRSAVVTQTTTSLSNATGVNLDQQLSAMLDLEHSYQASAELIKTVNAMYSSLLAAIH